MINKIILVLIFFQFLGCKPTSSCKGKRKIYDRTQLVLKYEEENYRLLKTKDDKRYSACNLPDTLVDQQNYLVKLKLLEIKPFEKLLALPVEIASISIDRNQQFHDLDIDKRILFTGGNGISDTGAILTIGVEIEKWQDNQIKYVFTELSSGITFRETKGTAIFNNRFNEFIEVGKSKIVAANQFEDLENGISIFITKNFSINKSKAKIQNTSTEEFTGLMHFK